MLLSAIIGLTGMVKLQSDTLVEMVPKLAIAVESTMKRALQSVLGEHPQQPPAAREQKEEEKEPEISPEDQELLDKTTKIIDKYKAGCPTFDEMWTKCRGPVSTPQQALYQPHHTRASTDTTVSPCPSGSKFNVLAPYCFEKLYMMKRRGEWHADTHPILKECYIPSVPGWDPTTAAGMKLPTSMEGKSFKSLWANVDENKANMEIRVRPEFINSFLVCKAPDVLYEGDDNQVVEKNSWQRVKVHNMVWSEAFTWLSQVLFNPHTSAHTLHSCVHKRDSRTHSCATRGVLVVL